MIVLLKRCIAVAAAGFLVLCGSATTAQSLQKITITYASFDPNQNAPYVAQQKGYFAAEGLDAELQYAGGGTATPALISGTIAASGSAASALSAILKGAPLRIVGIIASSSTYRLWVRNDIKKPSDLVGKAIGVASRGDTLEIAARMYLQSVGVNPDSVIFQPLGQPSGIGAGLDTGVLPAAIIATADSGIMRDKGELKDAHVLADLSKLKMPYSGLAMSEKLYYGDPVLAKKVIRAVIKGFRYMKAFKPQTLVLLEKLHQTQDQSAIEAAYDQESKAFTRDYTMTDAEVMPDLAVRAALLGMPKDKIPPINKIYDFTLAHQVNAELDASHWKPAP